MTQAPLTVTDHLRSALTALEHADGENTATQFLVARAEIERALTAIQRARCDAQTAIDRF